MVLQTAHRRYWAGQDAGGGVDLVDFFRCDGRLGKGGEVSVGEEEVEVGHDITYLLYLLVKYISDNPYSFL